MFSFKSIFCSFKRYFYEGDIWILAIRSREKKLLFEGNESPFCLIPNSFLYWKADPFLFEYQDEHYVFAEMFNRLTGRGCIGVSKIIDGRCTAFKTCLKLPFHLSYPCVFKYNNSIYMIPEMAASGKIYLFKCISFPDKWREEKILCEFPGVDTTPIPQTLSRNCKAVTTLHINNKDNDNLYLIGVEENSLVNLYKDNLCSRSAGHFIEKDGIVIHPVQDCTDYYGKELVFKIVKGLPPDSWHEEFLLRVTFPNAIQEADNALKVRITEKKTCHYKGIHTYNIDSKYEIVDLQFNVGFSWQYLIRKIRKHFIKRFKN